MPLDKPTLQTSLEAIFEYESTQEVSPELSRQRVASKMADAIEAYVKSGDGQYQPATLKAGGNIVTANVAGATIKIV
jgi:hypothetical protein